MIGYFKGSPVSQITGILRDQRLFTEDEVIKALKEYADKNPVKVKNRGYRR